MRARAGDMKLGAFTIGQRRSCHDGLTLDSIGTLPNRKSLRHARPLCSPLLETIKQSKLDNKAEAIQERT